MLAIAIKDLEMCLDNLNLLLEKNIIKFELLDKKEEINKQTADTL